MKNKFVQRTFIVLVFLLTIFLSVAAEEITVSSPDGHLRVSVVDKEGVPVYAVTYKDKTILEDSPLGMITSIGDFSKHLMITGTDRKEIREDYSIKTIKTSQVSYVANELTITYANNESRIMNLIFRVSNNDIAFRYTLEQFEETRCCTILEEATGFNFPGYATTFLTPQATPMIGWMRTKPSYEEEYLPDAPINQQSLYGVGYTFPGLFRIGEDGWALVSETGVSSAYCASRLSDPTEDGLYTIAFPEAGENNGIGSSSPSIPLPGETPWRTITVGDNLKPIVETTVPFDVVTPLYEASTDYKHGRSTWSWIMWQDDSVCYEDQIAYIDLAAEMGYEYVLIDGLWDKQIGYEKVEELIRYAQSKSVDVFLWYNSNGYWNDAPQGPRQKMNNSIVRKGEMKWMQSMGVKGIKVDFFGGDKQETMKLYEDILSEANEYGIMVIFHGCTLPRGWERMYPNYIGSEAVLASENLIFTQHANDQEAYNACLHPFIRNAVGSMEFGPVLLNKRHDRTNQSGRIRKTTDVFQIATAVLFQSPVQMFAIAPNNLTDAPAFAIEFMKKVPTTWDETLYIDGYPGRYCVLARRHGEQWYVVAINAQEEVVDVKVNLPMYAGKKVYGCYDDKKGKVWEGEMKINENGELRIKIQPEGGMVMVSNNFDR